MLVKQNLQTVLVRPQACGALHAVCHVRRGWSYSTALSVSTKYYSKCVHKVLQYRHRYISCCTFLAIPHRLNEGSSYFKYFAKPFTATCMGCIYVQLLRFWPEMEEE